MVQNVLPNVNFHVFGQRVLMPDRNHRLRPHHQNENVKEFIVNLNRPFSDLIERRQDFQF